MTGAPDPAPPAPLHGALLVDRSSLGRIRLTGKDRQDFLHRLSTNDINALRAGEGALSVLLSPRGRILDLLQVLAGADDLRLVTSEGNGDRVRAWLDGYLFREEVALEPDPADGCLCLCGPGAANLLGSVAGGSWDSVPVGHHRSVRLGAAGAVAAATYPLGGSGFLILPEPGEGGAVREALVAAGARPAPEPELEPLRIVAGIPIFGRELTEDYNPWEAGLDRAISLTKGCYLGQEVVARLRTYRKVRRRLCLMELAEGPPPEPGASVARAGREVGRITSAALSPLSGRPLALGFVDVPSDRPGEELTIVADQVPRPARVLPPPFFHPIPET